MHSTVNLAWREIEVRLNQYIAFIIKNFYANSVFSTEDKPKKTKYEAYNIHQLKAKAQEDRKSR